MILNTKNIEWVYDSTHFILLSNSYFVVIVSSTVNDQLLRTLNIFKVIMLGIVKALLPD